MPALGVLILLAQIACAVHVVRTGRNYLWIFLIVFVPLIGMAVYFFAEILPELMGSRTTRRAASGIGRAIDPGRGLREAQRRVQITPTTENKAILAEEYLRARQPAEAVALYREALTGIHATDAGMMLGLARALFTQGEAGEAERVLEDMREANPGYSSPEAQLLHARSLEAQGKIEAALKAYAALVPHYPGQEARCRYAMLLQQSGQADAARHIFEEVCQLIEYGPRHQRRDQREWYDLAKRSLA
jgi:hypothetical protein